MSFYTSTKNFQNAFVGYNPDEELTRNFYLGVLRYLNKRRTKLQDAAILYDWIIGGNPMLGFMCSPEYVQYMTKALIIRHIPFVCVSEPRGDIGFLIRDMDGENADEAKRSVLDQAARYCRIVDYNQLKEDILLSENPDKEMIHINLLTAEQADILVQLLETYTDGLEVALDEMEDGTWMFSFFGGLVHPKKQKKSIPMGQLLVLLMLRSEGYYADQHNRAARNHAAFEKAVACEFRGEDGKIDLRVTPAWVVGSGQHYVCIDGNGFEYGVAVRNAGEITLEAQYRTDSMSPAYQNDLYSYLARICDPAVTYNQQQAVRHLSGMDSGLRYDLPTDARIVSHCEEEAVEIVNELLQVKSIDYTMHEKGLETYMRLASCLLDEARMLLNEAIQEKCPNQMAYMELVKKTPLHQIISEYVNKIDPAQVRNGFALNDIRKVAAAFSDHGQQLEPYKCAISDLGHMAISMTPAQHDRVQSISQALGIDDPHKDQGKEHDRYSGSPEGPGR